MSNSTREQQTLKSSCLKVFKNVICNSKINKPAHDYEYVSYDISVASPSPKPELPNPQSASKFFKSLYGSPILPCKNLKGHKLTSTQLLHEQTAQLVHRGYYDYYESQCNESSVDQTSCTSGKLTDSTVTSLSCSCFSNSYHMHTCQYAANYSSLMTSDYSSLGSSSNCSSQSDSSKSINSNGDIFICHTDYKAKLDGDLSLKCFDKVKMIVLTPTDAASNTYVLVQLISNGALGYVPRKCLISLKEYLNNN